MSEALSVPYLGPRGPALGVGDDPDVVRPKLEVVHLAGDAAESMGGVNALVKLD